MANDTHLSLCNSLNLAVEWKCVKTDLPIMFPTGNFKSRKSTLGMGRFSGIGPVRVLLPAPSVKSKLGRSLRKKDLQNQTRCMDSDSSQDGVYHVKKNLFRVNNENQEQSRTLYHDRYEDISGIDEILPDSHSSHKNSVCPNKREVSRKVSSALTFRQDFLYNTNNINLTNKNEHKLFHSSVYTNLDNHDEDQLSQGSVVLFPLNNGFSISEDEFLNKNHELNLQSKLTTRIIDDTENFLHDVETIHTNSRNKEHINICEKTTSCTPHIYLPNHLIVNKNNAKGTEEFDNNKHVTQPDFFKVSTCTEKQQNNFEENVNNDSVLSFTLNEITCISNDIGADSITKCFHEQSSKKKPPNEQKQTTETIDKKEFLVPENRCKCCMNTSDHIKAVVTVIENTQTYIQSIEEKVEQLKNSLRQLDVIKYDLTNRIQKSNGNTCECFRSKILNDSGKFNDITDGIKKVLLADDFQGTNSDITNRIGTEDSKISPGNANKFNKSDNSQFKCESKEQSTINHINHLLSSSVSHNEPEITLQQSTSGKKTVLVKNVSFRIPHHTPISSRKKQVYSNYKTRYNMCVRTPESSSKFKRQVNMSLVLTPHSMSDRLSTQIGTLFQS